MIRPLDLDDTDVVADVLRVQAAAYEVEARWLGVEVLPAARDTPEQLRSSGETFVGQLGPDGAVLGLVSWRRTPTALDICRLAVDPAVARQGIGRRLVRVSLQQPGVDVVTVSTGTANEPALALYASEGFVAVGEEVVGGEGAGVRITRLERRP